MAFHRSIFVSFDVGTMLKQIWENVLQRYDPVAITYVSRVLGAYGGYRAVIFQRRFGTPDVEETVFQCLGLAAGASANAKQMAGAAGFQAPVIYYPPRGHPPGLDVAGTKTMFAEQYLAIIEWILEDWCGAIVDVRAPFGFLVTDIYAGTIAAAVEVQTDGECFAFGMSCGFGFPLVAANDGTVVRVEVPAQLSSASSAPGGDRSSELADIVTALRDIALRSTVTSINDRTAIVELGTNDILIPGGG